jgi:hypothetical protein
MVDVSLLKDFKFMLCKWDYTLSVYELNCGGRGWHNIYFFGLRSGFSKSDDPDCDLILNKLKANSSLKVEMCLIHDTLF